MSNVRSYLKNKKKSNTELQNKIIKYRLKVIYRVSLVLFAAIIIGILIKISLDNRIFNEYIVTSTVDWKIASNTVCKEYNGNVLSYTKDGASCTSSSGKALWNQTYQMQKPIIDINGDYVAIGDYNGHIIYVMNSNGEKNEIDTKMPIQKLSVSKNGIVVAILDDSSITGIYVFDKEGNTLVYFKTTMDKSGYPIDVSISDNSMMVAVSYLYGDTGSITSNVAFYNFDSVGANYTDNLVSAYNYIDAIVPEVEFMNQNTAFALADNRLMIYKGKQIPSSSADILLKEQVLGVYHSSQYIALVHPNTSGETKYKLAIYNDSGTIVKTIQFDFEYTDIKLKEDLILIYNEMSCELYTIKGVLKFAGEFQQSVLTVIPTSKQNVFVLVSKDKIDTIELR